MELIPEKEPSELCLNCPLPASQEIRDTSGFQRSRAEVGGHVRAIAVVVNKPQDRRAKKHPASKCNDLIASASSL